MAIQGDGDLDEAEKPRADRRRTIAVIGSGIAAGVAAVLVVGTVGGSGGASVDDKPVTPVVPKTQESVLSAALDQWKAFPVDADVRPIVLLAQAHAPAAFAKPVQKAKFLAGHWADPAAMPKSPAKAGGYPVVPATEALKRLRALGTDGGTAAKGAILKVTDMRLSVVRAPTDRGPVALPAWRVMITGAAGPAWVPAVAAPAAYDYAAATGLPPVKAVASKNGRTLTLRFAGAPDVAGPCGADYTAQVSVSAQAVAVELVKKARTAVAGAKASTAKCSKALVARTATVPLDARLGDRVLLGVLGGDAVVTGPYSVTKAKAAKAS